MRCRRCRCKLIQDHAADRHEVSNLGWGTEGRRAEAEKLIAEAPIRYPDRRGPHQFAVVFAGFGDRDHTIERLESLARAGPVRLGFTLNSPEFAFVRGDPRLKTLRKKVEG